MKRRLVGALVIVLLAIILVPAWLDGSARRLRDEEAFVVPLPPPDNRKAMVEPESIGEQIATEIPKLEPLPEPETVPEPAAEKVADAAQATAQKVEDLASSAAENEGEVAEKSAEVSAAAQEVIPEPVEVDLNQSQAKTNTASGATSAIKVEVAENAEREVVDKRANWIVQVGSFASKQNAEAMVSRLKKGELKAFMREFQSNGDTIYRVLVGPFIRQTEADEAKRTIDRRFQVKSFVANWRG
ncbi:MAG: SPOR domain-containing protein [Granulosicoccaceae bacterium]